MKKGKKKDFNDLSDIFALLKINVDEFDSLKATKEKLEKDLEEIGIKINLLTKWGFICRQVKNYWRKRRYDDNDGCYLLAKTDKRKNPCGYALCDAKQDGNVVMRDRKGRKKQFFEIVVIRELLTEAELEDYELTTDQYFKKYENSRGFNIPTVPPWHRVVSIDEIYTEKCSKCGKISPLIFHYYSSSGGYGYDGSQIYEFFSLCCPKKM